MIKQTIKLFFYVCNLQVKLQVCNLQVKLQVYLQAEWGQ